MMQVRTPYFRDSVEGALRSSSYNLDVTLAVWRNCYEGGETWLNHVERGRDYTAGDAWGCIGRWFSGRWYTAPAVAYINEVQDYLSRRIWTTPEFIDFRG
jgi:autotransporter family porin